VPGRLDSTKLLLGLGADVEALTSGSTALCIAARNDHFAVVDCLLEAGASVLRYRDRLSRQSSIIRLDLEMVRMIAVGASDSFWFHGCNEHGHGFTTDQANPS
jgi:ankyrin repeat protein